MAKKASEAVEGEKLDILIGSQPLKDLPDDKKKEAVKENVLRILNEKYGVEEEDFLSAELEIVPAGKARDCGLDRSMIAGYGQDDRVCAYTSLLALLEMEAPKRTSCCLLVDKEEIGSVGATGMQSHFFENSVAEVLDAMGQYSDLRLRKALKNSSMLSSDVSAGYDPAFAEAFEKKNSAYLGRGIVLNKFTGARGNPAPMMPMQSMWQESAGFLTTIRFASRLLSLVRLTLAAAEPSLLSQLFMVWK